ncbi:MAG TPA: helix-turn-helix domain-containing protein, partial [Anaerolineales bacterium]|nr:helix-turn-helix domain-containing protein [Anaerolineales bacterium]
MLFSFEERPSDSPFVERIWCAQSERSGDFLSVAASQWEMVVSKYRGETIMTVRGPETKATPMHVTLVGGEFFGIIFKYGAFMPHFPVSHLVDADVDLPNASSKSFWLNGSAWQFPNYENADTFVDRLVREELLVCDPIIEAALRGEPQDLSPRSVQRHFLQATGLTHGSIRQIERARHATMLLQQGVSILDTVDRTGYSDQAHLT